MYEVSRIEPRGAERRLERVHRLRLLQANGGDVVTHYPTPYRDPRWRHVRQAILARDGHTCMIRGTRCTLIATQVDHIVPWRELDPSQWFAPELLRAACRPCNSQRGARRQHELAEQARRMLRDGNRGFREW
jgi:5-methylcytosine-specific restriction endonuclease McrA